jgi:hypothetical protein
LVIGHLSFVIGHWSFVLGHWSFVIGGWGIGEVERDLAEANSCGND